MKEIDILETDALEACLQAYQSFPVVMIQFPEVFGLMAIPNQDGVNGLNRVKSRMPEKYYGSVIGDTSKFLGMGLDTENPTYLNSESDFLKLEGSIIRIRVDKAEKSSFACMNGTHQGLLFKESPTRELFRKLEIAFESSADPTLFLGHYYSAPLCTSANLSGHPDGSITSLETARIFGEKMGIPLLLRASDYIATEKGSYPVLALEKSRIVVERKGPGLEEIISHFEPGLFQYR
jgi:tRNA A37 threonylcarbamoyladenosine synthetase subunit TsaC/SUA5/YrdC